MSMFLVWFLVAVTTLFSYGIAEPQECPVKVHRVVLKELVVTDFRPGQRASIFMTLNVSKPMDLTIYEIKNHIATKILDYDSSVSLNIQHRGNSMSIHFVNNFVKIGDNVYDTYHIVMTEKDDGPCPKFSYIISVPKRNLQIKKPITFPAFIKGPPRSVPVNNGAVHVDLAIEYRERDYKDAVLTSDGSFDMSLGYVHLSQKSLTELSSPGIHESYEPDITNNTYNENHEVVHIWHRSLNHRFRSTSEYGRYCLSSPYNIDMADFSDLQLTTEGCATIIPEDATPGTIYAVALRSGFRYLVDPKEVPIMKTADSDLDVVISGYPAPFAICWIKRDDKWHMLKPVETLRETTMALYRYRFTANDDSMFGSYECEIGYKSPLKSLKFQTVPYVPITYSSPAADGDVQADHDGIAIVHLNVTGDPEPEINCYDNSDIEWQPDGERAEFSAPPFGEKDGSEVLKTIKDGVISYQLTVYQVYELKGIMCFMTNKYEERFFSTNLYPYDYNGIPTNTTNFILAQFEN